MWSAATFSRNTWKNRARRRRQGETLISPTTESRSWRSRASWIGVRPEGARVRRRTGWSKKPLSSKKTSVKRRRFAPFLSAATLLHATGGWPLRRVRVPAARASDSSSPSCGESSTRDRGRKGVGTSAVALFARPEVDDQVSLGRSGPLACVQSTHPTDSEMRVDPNSAWSGAHLAGLFGSGR